MEEERTNLTATEVEENIEVSQNRKKSKEKVPIEKGGLKTMPFIIVNEAFEKVASYGILPNMILYVMNEYHMSMADGGSILSLWSALSNFLAIFGAFISDSYLGRFRVILLGSIASLLGMTLLWLTAMVPQAKPPPCDSLLNICKSPTPAQLALLLVSFGFISIGSGCIRPCSIAFGADQLVKKDNPKNERIIDSFFNWYYAFTGISTILAFTVIIYIQENLGWKVGFGVPAVLMFLSAFFFIVGSSFYIQVNVESSLLTKLAQVFVAAFKKRHLSLPLDNSDEFYYHQDKDSKLVAPSDKLRFLNKACIIRDTEEELNLDGSASNPWELCTVHQVEVLKSLLRIIPIWSTGVFINLTVGSSAVIQANTMDRHITSTFQFPAGSFTLFTVLTLTIWVAFYDRVIVPLLAKHTGNPHGINPMQRMGVGLVFSCIAMAVGAIVESIRRRIAIQEGFSEDPTAVVNMSAMWLVPQFCLSGLAEAFNAIGQIEFYYTKIPKSMSSIAVGIFTLGMAVSGLLGSLLITIVDNVTKSGGKVSWLSGNPNKGHYDYNYWLMCFLSLLNFLYFLGCCWAYGPFEEGSKVSNEGEDLKKSLLSQSRELPSSSSV